MTTSRERREAVRDALILHHHVSEDGDISFAAMADAALVAALPDKTTFDNALTELVACAMEWGVHEGEGRITADEQERLTNEAADVVRSLVYGDDAQAGDQEGAEHE